MDKLKEELKYFWSQKCFSIGLVLTMLLSYITLLINPTIGIDDTAVKVYFIDGVAPATGRWCLYLINKLFPIEYNPYFVEATGLLIFCLSISLWCVVFHRIFGDRISVFGYTVFGGVMISSPIFSELAVWYLQNGSYMAYGVTALAVLLAMESFREDIRKNYKKRFARVVAGALALTVAIGFYESFMFVFLMAMVMIFMSVRVLDKKEFSARPADWLINMAALGGCAMAFRSIIFNSIVAIFGLESQRFFTISQRGLTVREAATILPMS